MIRRLAGLALVAAALAGCSDDNKGSAGVDPVTWAENVCKSVEGQAAVMTQSPDLDPGDPQKAKDVLLTYLGNLSAGLDKLAGGVREAGTPSVTDGAQVVSKVTKTLQDATKGVQDARANLEKATVTDAASFEAARDSVGQDLAKLSDIEDPTKDLKANAELNDAFNKAPTCKKLDESSPSTPPSR